MTPPQIDPKKFAETLAEALDGGDVACVQLRLKAASNDAAHMDAIRMAAEALLPICHARDVPLLINDQPKLAKEVGADGAHIGQQDTPYAEARAILGEDAILGVTCHDQRHLAIEAAEAGADYVAFGAFYPTPTKATESHPDPEILTWWHETTTVPCVAIGGINVENCAPLVAAGADFLAVLHGIWAYEDGPGQAVRAFNRVISKAAQAGPPPATP